MKKIIVMISICILLCGCANKNEKKEVRGITSVTCEKALDLQAEQGLIVDVREEDEYEEGHLEDAVNIPYTEIVDKIDEYVADKDSVIIVYCKSGKRSGIAAKSLSEAGYKNIYDLGSINNCN